MPKVEMSKEKQAKQKTSNEKNLHGQNVGERNIEKQNVETSEMSLLTKTDFLSYFLLDFRWLANIIFIIAYHEESINFMLITHICNFPMINFFLVISRYQYMY